jgi:hypothetical protein
LAASPGSLVGVVIALETRNAGTNILPKIAAESHEIRQTQKPDQGKIKMGINELGVLHGRLITCWIIDVVLGSAAFPKE